MSAWNDHLAGEAKRLWIEGKSATEIARSIPGKFTRNAVIGKLHRMGVTSAHRMAPKTPPLTGAARSARWRNLNAPSVTVREQTRRAPKPGPHNKPGAVFGKVSILDQEAADKKRAQMRGHGQAAIQRVIASDIESPNAVPLLEHTKGCRWPLGERGDVRFCCNPVRVEGGPYCEGHHAVSLSPFQPERLREPRAANDQPRKTPRPRVQTGWDDAREAA